MQLPLIDATEEEARALYGLVDINGDNRVSKDELEHLLYPDLFTMGPAGGTLLRTAFLVFSRSHCLALVRSLARRTHKRSQACTQAQ